MLSELATDDAYRLRKSLRDSLLQGGAQNRHIRSTLFFSWGPIWARIFAVLSLVPSRYVIDLIKIPGLFLGV